MMSQMMSGHRYKSKEQMEGNLVGLIWLTLIIAFKACPHPVICEGELFMNQNDIDPFDTVILPRLMEQ